MRAIDLLRAYSQLKNFVTMIKLMLFLSKKLTFFFSFFLFFLSKSQKALMAAKTKGGRRRGAVEHGRLSSSPLPSTSTIGNKNSEPANLPVEENSQVPNRALTRLFSKLSEPFCRSKAKEKTPAQFHLLVFSSILSLPLIDAIDCSRNQPSDS